MLYITVKPREYWDDIKECFYYPFEGDKILQLEHSLLSLSKYEEITKKPLLYNMANGDFSHEDLILYIKCMTINKNIPQSIYSSLTNSEIESIINYIGDNRTATVVKTRPHKKKSVKQNQYITSELIYYWLVQLQIPFTVEKWNLNRLFTLIDVCIAEQEEPTKLNTKDIMKRNRALNAKNKARLKHH